MTAIPTRTMTFELQVTVPAATGESEVQNAINQALDEPPCDWGRWIVGAAVITKVERGEVDLDSLYDDDEDEDEVEEPE